MMMLSKRRAGCYTPLETHRLKQREQYKTMLSSLDTLTNCLPYISTDSRMRTKQMILTECARYIQYLQILIWKYSMDLKRPEREIFPILVYDGQYLSDNVLTILDCIHPLSTDTWRTVKHTSSIRSNKKRKVKALTNCGGDGSKSKKKFQSRILRNSSLQLSTKELVIEEQHSSTKIKNETFTFQQMSTSNSLTSFYLNLERNNIKPAMKLEKNLSTFQIAQESKKAKKCDYQVMSPAKNRSRMISMTNSPIPTRIDGKCDWNDVAMKSPIPWMPRPSYVEETSPFSSSLLKRIERNSPSRSSRLFVADSPQIYFGTPSSNSESTSGGSLSSNYRLFAISPFGSPELFPGVGRNPRRIRDNHHHV